MIPIDEKIKPIVTIQTSDPYDEREGVFFSKKDLDAMAKLKPKSKLYTESALAQAEERGRLAGLREAAEKYKYLVEAAEKVSAYVVDGQSMRVSIEDLIALKNTCPIRPATTGRLDQELVCLFGRDTVQEAISTDPAILRLSPALMDSVYNAADDLLAHPDKPATQRGIVFALEPLTRLVLCMWLQDLNLPAKLNLGSKNRAVHT